MGMINMNPTLQTQITDFRFDADEKIQRLESVIARLEVIPTAPEFVSATDLTVRRGTADVSRAFIVHGHDEAAKQSVARFLEKQGIEAIILHEQASGGR